MPLYGFRLFGSAFANGLCRDYGGREATAGIAGRQNADVR